MNKKQIFRGNTTVMTDRVLRTALKNLKDVNNALKIKYL